MSAFQQKIAGLVKRQEETESEEATEPNLVMTHFGILREFKIIMINLLRALMEKVDSM